MTVVRTLIVDDSATARHLLTVALSQDPEIEVVGCAPEPTVARRMIKELDPDVVTLDIEMPNMNGLDFLERIMRLRPMPVVMISTLTARGAAITIEALELGAVDFFPKPTGNVASVLNENARELAEKVKAAARTKPRPRTPRARPSATPDSHGFVPADKIIAIGASTGGVEALITVLANFPENCCPTVITQHMPAGFTKSFAARLDRLCRPRVAEAFDDAPLEPGRIYLAPGAEAHLSIAGRSKAMRCRLVRSEAQNGHRPSVDVMFKAVAAAAGSASVGALLTGMGKDGAAGLKAMRDSGAFTISQDEASSIVYGMPRAAFEMGAVDKQLPLDDIGAELVRHCQARN
jgi:two-component system, chemotaxis family, protein-glutamate methylesterase/glutaminase